MYNPFSLAGKRILITGGSSGIGRQCAIDCSRMGAKVVIIGRDEKRLQETLLQMEGKGHAYRVFDLNQTNCIAELIAEIVLQTGKFNGFVHAAGVETTKPLKLLSPEDYEQVYRTNAISGFEFARHLSNIKSFDNSGAMVFIASITAIIARAGVSAYSASKGAIISTTRVMALELAKKRIRVNSISPGTVLTPLIQRCFSKLDEDTYKERVSGFPLGIGEPTDISTSVIFLLSDASKWITGQNLIVDGGYTIK